MCIRGCIIQPKIAAFVSGGGVIIAIVCGMVGVRFVYKTVRTLSRQCVAPDHVAVKLPQTWPLQLVPSSSKIFGSTLFKPKSDFLFDLLLDVDRFTGVHTFAIFSLQIDVLGLEADNVFFPLDFDVFQFYIFKLGA